MEILSEYPKQVIVLKGTQKVCGLRGRRAGLQRRLIDEGQTQGFGKYCRDIEAAERGDMVLQKKDFGSRTSGYGTYEKNAI